MLNRSARLLRLLSLLAARRDWTATALAQRLGVTERTVRRDVERLRSIGYPVHATSGPAGGYRLAAGANLPPLLLDDDEAVAVAVGLRTAAGGTVDGIEETWVQALAKLEQVLPSRLRQRVAALQAATVPLSGAAPSVDPGALVLIASACRDLERLRFVYCDHEGQASLRVVEPHRPVHTGRRWYLVARDVERDAWRTFRVDRIENPLATGRCFTAHDPPDAATYVTRPESTGPYRYHCRVRVQAPATVIAQRVPPTAVLVEAVEANVCLLTTGSDSLDALTAHLLLLGADFEVLQPPELIEHVRAAADRQLRAAQGSACSMTGDTQHSADLAAGSVRLPGWLRDDTTPELPMSVNSFLVGPTPIWPILNSARAPGAREFFAIHRLVSCRCHARVTPSLVL